MQKKKNKDNILKRMINNIKKVYKKKIVKNKTKYTLKETIVVLLITFLLGLFIGGVIMYSMGRFGKNAMLYEFASAYDEIVDSYYEEVDSDKLLESGISGMMKYLGDPYSTFMNKESASAFNEDVEGIYHGIGAEVKYDAKFENVSLGQIFENSPAEKAGLKTGDILLKVNGESIKGLSLSKIAEKVKGKDGTDVTITIKRDEEEKDVTLKRGAVDSISVTSKIIEKADKKIGYIYISVFANNTIDQFKKELEQVEKEDIYGLIIDVRSNNGGYLTTVTDIISLFTKKNDVIYQLKTKDKIELIKDKTEEHREYPMVVLTNAGSASASEVLTGALQESYGATVVGTKTFGKGKVQKVSTLSSGAMIKYTNQEWLTPKGNYIDGKGIEPDIEEKYLYDDQKDNQLDKAVSVILEK